MSAAWRKATRAMLLARRDAMPAAARQEAEATIGGRVLALLMGRPGVVGLYWPIRGEFDPRPLASVLHAAGTRLALPVVMGKAEPLLFRPWVPGAPMTPGAYAIPVPDTPEAVRPETLLVPLLGFDTAGFRLGYGGGFYDRTLAAMAPRPFALGVGFEAGRLPSVMPEPHDIPMDAVVTDAP